jgi:hypothetical protein
MLVATAAASARTRRRRGVIAFSSRPGPLAASTVAEFERSLIIARTSEGRAIAKAAGVRFGRPFALSRFQRAEAARSSSVARPPHAAFSRRMARTSKRRHSRFDRRLLMTLPPTA